MKRTFRILLLVISVLVSSFSLASAEVDIPDKPVSSIYMQDQADMLSGDTERLVEAYGHALNQKTRAQIVVLTVDSLGDATPEEYGLAVLRGWGIGDREKNNGLLLLIGRDDHKLRIEVGYGLEGAVNDAAAGRILDNIVTPAFRNEEYDKGVLEAYAALLDRTLKEYDLTRADLGVSEGLVLPADTENTAVEDEEDEELDFLGIIGILVLFAGALGVYYIMVKGVTSIFGLWGGGSGSDDYDSSSSDSDSYGGGSGGGGGSSGSW